MKPIVSELLLFGEGLWKQRQRGTYLASEMRRRRRRKGWLRPQNTHTHCEREREMGEGENTEIETETESEATSTWSLGKHIQIIELSEKLMNGNLSAKIEAAREIRKMVRKSSSPKTRAKLATAGVIEPLVLMLSSSNVDARQSSLLTLLNLVVRNERYPPSSLPRCMLFCEL